MIVTAWHNGTAEESGAGYGLKVRAVDRDTYFKRSWTSAVIVLPDGNEANVNVAKQSFWGRQCRELISAAIGRWMLAEELAPWADGKPPRLELEPEGEARFSLRPLR